MNQKYYIVTFSYELTKLTRRYIPINEINECYFVMCNDPNCNLRENYCLHPKGVKNCSTPFNPCTNSLCPVETPHICHPRCINKRQLGDPLPNFINEHLCSLPKGQKVYHFTKKSFKKMRQKNCIGYVKILTPMQPINNL